MSTPLASIFHGDVTLEQGSDVSQFGWGDLSVNRNAFILGTDDSTGGLTSGCLIVSGGARVAKSMHVHQNQYVLYGITYLTETHIDTTTSLTGGGFTVTGGNAIYMAVDASSQFISNLGNLSLKSEVQSLVLRGGLNSCSAVDIEATNVAGGVKVLSGANGCISLTAGAGGFSTLVSNGNLTLTCNNGSGSFIVNSTTDNQNLVVSLTGPTDSQIKIESSGTNVTRTALVINTSDKDGDIQISNKNGLGNSKIDLLAGSDGLNITSNTFGAITLTSQAASTSVRVFSDGPDQDLTLYLKGNTNSKLELKSEGVLDAIKLQTLSNTGNISIANTSGSGKVDILTGTGGFNATTLTGGSIVMTTYGATSTYTNATTSDNQHLTISVTGDTNSKVIVSSQGTSNEAIKLETNTGGVYVNSAGGIQLQSTNTMNGVQIATANPGVPVRIGTTSSTTTILGDLFVRGNTSSVDQQVVTVDDNILLVNSAPFGTSDGGLAIKRFQSANNTGSGDVVLDTPEETGTVQNGDNDATHIKLESTSNTLNDYYNGWWVMITGGTGAGQVRRIKTYDGITKIATIYSTIEQTGILDNPQPVEGLDFDTIPDTTSTYALYPCHYVMSIWDESANEFALVCSSSSPLEQANISHYTNLHINNLDSNAIFTSSINNSLADISFNITLTDNSSVPVAFPSTSGLPYTHFPKKYGVYIVFVKPTTSTTRAHAIFLIGRINVNVIPGTVIRPLSIKGASNEQLDMQWRADEYPELYYRPYPGGGTSTSYTIKVISL